MPLKKEKLNLFTRYFKPILFLTVVIILGAAYFLLLSPLFKEYQTLTKQVIEEKRENLEQQKKIFNELSELNKVYNEVSPSLKDKVQELLPTQPALPNLYYNLDQLATVAGYKILSVDINVPKQEQKKSTQEFRAPTEEMGEGEEIRPAEMTGAKMSEPAISQKSLKEIKITLELEGNGYLTFKNFLDLLEHNLRILEVESFSYDPEETTISLNLKTYYYQ